MNLLALGVNHNSAPVAVRERITILPDQTIDALQDLRTLPGVGAAAILSTCNRTELYCSMEHDDVGLPWSWFHEYHRLTPGELDRFRVHHLQEQAVRHVFRVAAGLDSMVLGEPEILGQLKDAYRLARAASSLSLPLDKLMQSSFRVAKKVRSETEVGFGAVSFASATIELARRIFERLEDQTALIIGAGEMAALCAHQFRRKGIERLIFVNRTLSKAQALALQHAGVAHRFEELPKLLAKADLVVATTSAREALVSAADLQRASKERKRRPILATDLGVPRNIDEAASKLRDIYLYSIDDLRKIIDAGLSRRKLAAEQAETLVDSQVDEFIAWLRERAIGGTIRQLRERAHASREALVDKAKHELALGADPEDVAERLAYRLTNQLLHKPTVHLRRAAREGRVEELELVKRNLGIPEDE